MLFRIGLVRGCLDGSGTGADSGTAPRKIIMTDLHESTVQCDSTFQSIQLIFKRDNTSKSIYRCDATAVDRSFLHPGTSFDPDVHFWKR